jgi:hypothetical protein
VLCGLSIVRTHSSEFFSVRQEGTRHDRCATAIALGAQDLERPVTGVHLCGESFKSVDRTAVASSGKPCLSGGQPDGRILVRKPRLEQSTIVRSERH